MAIQLDDILSEIEARILAVSPTVVFYKGERELNRNEIPPRIVWVYGPETYDDPEKSKDNPRSIKTAVATVIGHIWGTSRDSAVNLKQSLHVAAYRVAYGSFEPISTSWEELEQVNAEYGAACRFEMQFRIPVPDEIVPEVLITGFAPAEDSVPGDGILQCGET